MIDEDVLNQGGTVFDYRLSIMLMELLYYDFALPFTPEGNSMENNNVGFKDPNAPSKALYWKQLTSIWSNSKFETVDLYRINKRKRISDI